MAGLHLSLDDNLFDDKNSRKCKNVIGQEFEVVLEEIRFVLKSSRN